MRCSTVFVTNTGFPSLVIPSRTRSEDVIEFVGDSAFFSRIAFVVSNNERQKTFGKEAVWPRYDHFDVTDIGVREEYTSM